MGLENLGETLRDIEKKKVNNRKELSEQEQKEKLTQGLSDMASEIINEYANLNNKGYHGIGGKFLSIRTHITGVSLCGRRENFIIEAKTFQYCTDKPKLPITNSSILIYPVENGETYSHASQYPLFKIGDKGKKNVLSMPTMPEKADNDLDAINTAFELLDAIRKSLHERYIPKSEQPIEPKGIGRIISVFRKSTRP
jgi:hypothetical protein